MRGSGDDSISQKLSTMAVVPLPTTFNTVLKPSVIRSIPATIAIPSNGNPEAANTVVMVINAEPGTPGVLKEIRKLLRAMAVNKEFVS